MTTELDTEIRRAVAVLADAAPMAPTFDELSDRSLARRPGASSRRPLATAGAAVLAAAAMVAVLLTVRASDERASGPDDSSTGTSQPDTMVEPVSVVTIGSTTPPPSTPVGTYVVRPGDYLLGIASANKVPLAALLAANDWTASTLIVPEQSLTLPTAVRPMTRAVDAGAGLPDTFARSLPPGLLLRQGTFRGADGRIVTLAAGSEDDGRQVAVWIVPGGDPSPTDRALAIVDDRPSSRSVEWVGPTGLLVGARAVDLDGGAAPLTVDELASLVDKMDVFVRVSPVGADGEPSPATPTTTTAVVPPTYVVVAGDYLLGIARKLGVSLPALLEANGMTASSVITVGQRLVVPAGGPTTASAVTERTPLDKRGRYVLDAMTVPLDGTASTIAAAQAVAVAAVVRRVREPPASVRVTVLLGSYIDTSAGPATSPRLAFAVRYESACTTVSPSGSVATTSEVCGPTTVVDVVTGDVIISLDG